MQGFMGLTEVDEVFRFLDSVDLMSISGRDFICSNGNLRKGSSSNMIGFFNSPLETHWAKYHPWKLEGRSDTWRNQGHWIH